MTVAGAIDLLSNNSIVGWALDTNDKNPARVDMLVDGHQVKTLRALRARPGFSNLVTAGRVEFNFRIHDSLAKYIRSAESITFKISGEVLPIVANEFKPLEPSAIKPLAELLRLMEKGYVVTKKGKVQLSIHLDTDWQRRVFDFYDYARKRFLELFAYDLHITYGTLLGHTRGSDFIPGDDDFDTAYLSKYNKPEDVRRELIHIASTLIINGEELSIARRKIIQWKGPRGIAIDVFPAWTDADNFYMSFAVGAAAGRAVREGFVDDNLRGRKVLVPRQKQKVVEAIYGPGWSTPDPHFQWVVPKHVRRVMRKISIDDASMAEIYWNRVYRAGSGAPPPSSFATFSRSQIPEAVFAVIDLGCGNGRDTLEVAGPHRAGLGLDYSNAAVQRNRETWPSARYPRLSFEQADVRDDASLVRATQSALVGANAPIAVYSRFFIHAIDDEAEATLLAFLNKALPVDSVLLFEFRTHLDAILEKTFGGHFRRFVNPEDFIKRVAASGRFSLVSKDIGTGLAPYKDEDPHVARLVFRAQH